MAKNFANLLEDMNLPTLGSPVNPKQNKLERSTMAQLPNC